MKRNHMATMWGHGYSYHFIMKWDILPSDFFFLFFLQKIPKAPVCCLLKIALCTHLSINFFLTSNSVLMKKWKKYRDFTGCVWKNYTFCFYYGKVNKAQQQHSSGQKNNWQVEQKPGGRGREWATLGVHPLSCLLSNNRLEKVPFVSVPHTSSNRLLLSNQDKGYTPSVAHSLALPLGPALLNLWNFPVCKRIFNWYHSMVRCKSYGPLSDE